MINLLTQDVCVRQCYVPDRLARARNFSFFLSFFLFNIKQAVYNFLKNKT